MTNDFAAELRRLDKAASPAPWSEPDNPPCLFDGIGDGIVHFGDEIGAYVHDDDAALIVALRNHASRLADVVEAAGALLDACVEENGGDMPTNDDHPAFALRSALAALKGDAAKGGA